MPRAPLGCAIRIGVNAGSLEQDIAERDDLTQPEKLVMSSERFVKHFEDRGFTNIVLSAKAHSVSNDARCLSSPVA